MSNSIKCTEDIKTLSSRPRFDKQAFKTPQKA
jgi:hypothetical protein